MFRILRWSRRTSGLQGTTEALFTGFCEVFAKKELRYCGNSPNLPVPAQSCHETGRDTSGSTAIFRSPDSGQMGLISCILRGLWRTLRLDHNLN